jgi:hypothetical protein
MLIKTGHKGANTRSHRKRHRLEFIFTNPLRRKKFNPCVCLGGGGGVPGSAPAGLVSSPLHRAAVRSRHCITTNSTNSLVFLSDHTEASVFIPPSWLFSEKAIYHSLLKNDWILFYSILIYRYPLGMKFLFVISLQKAIMVFMYSPEVTEHLKCRTIQENFPGTHT